MVVTQSGSTRIRLTITESANVYAEQIYAWVADNAVDEIRDLATAWIPNAPVGNGANVAALDHFAERGAFVCNPRDGVPAAGPPLPPHAARAVARATARAAAG